MDLDLILLCGGKGERFQAVSDHLPKVLTKIGNLTFLDYVIFKCIKYKINSIILATGHLQEKIEAHIKKNNYEIEIIFSKEIESLGTWGAIENAQKHLSKNSFFVMNGDTINDLNFNFASKFKNEKQIHYILFGEKIKNNRNFSYGNFTVSENNIVKSFTEKEKSLRLGEIIYRNSGIYLFNKNIFNIFNDKDYKSLEYDVLPKLIDIESVVMYSRNVKFFDFGTFERYHKLPKDFNFSLWV